MVALERVLHGRPPVLLTIWTALAFTAFALQHDVADCSVCLLPFFLAASIWLGVTLGQLTELAARSLTWAPAVIALVCVGYLGLRTSANLAQVDASHDIAAENYGRQVMTAAPARPILFAQGDQAVFTLWYFHYALLEWRDVAVIANDLLPLDWYRENLQYTYPDLAECIQVPQLWGCGAGAHPLCDRGPASGLFIQADQGHDRRSRTKTAWERTTSCSCSRTRSPKWRTRWNGFAISRMSSSVCARWGAALERGEEQAQFGWTGPSIFQALLMPVWTWEFARNVC